MVHVSNRSRCQWLLALLLLTSVGSVRADTVVRRVSFAQRADGAGMVVRLHTNEPVGAYSEPRLNDGHGIEIILFNARLADGYRVDAPSGPVRNTSVEARNGHLVFVFEIESEVEVEAAAYPDQQTNDLLVALSVTTPARPTVVAEDLREGERPASSARLGSAEAVPARPAPVSPSPSPSASSTTLRGAGVASGTAWQLDTIVIDAGHGGHDPGAVAHGVREKDINLKVALKLGEYLEELLGVRVVYTRTDDRFVELHERGHIANQFGGKLFISIHANSFRNSAIRGTETYFLGMHKSDEAREVIERENSVVKLESNPDQYAGFFQNSILQSLALSANMRMSERLAAKVNDEFVNRARRESRGVKQAGFIVLWTASMPAVLVELGYITNRFEAAFLNSVEGQDYLASAIFRAVRDYKAEYEKGLELTATR
jgi:N-acetylmuramoyl-L-alanine amidase